MTEAAENIEDNDVVDGQVNTSTESTEAKHDDKPAPRGYMSKEAWIESGKDPEKWVSEDEFKATGERIKLANKIRQEIRGDFENQLKNVNLLHQIQLKNQREELLSRRDDAIDVADKASVKALDKQIKELDDLADLAKENTSLPDKPVEVAQWENANPWVNDPKDPRTAIAQKTYIAAINAGIEPSEALDLVDSAISKKFSSKSVAPRQVAESSRQSSTSREPEAVTMKSLTAEEKKIWDTCSTMFGSEKEFLKSVANSRKGVK